MIGRVRDGDSGVRAVLLLLVAAGALGLCAELFLLEHFDEWTQWLPFAVLGAAVVACVGLWLRPRAGMVRAFRAVMALTIGTGLVGIWLHFAGNRAFELEMDGALSGWMLVWHSLRGATPALAPGAMIQLGLIGLVLTWRHPALTRKTEEAA